MKIDLLSLDDWQKSNLFKDFNNQALQHINHYKEAVQAAETNTFSMTIRNHTANAFQKIFFNSKEPKQKEVVFKNNEYFNLKTEKDSFEFSEILTDSITYGIDEIKMPKAIRYTFTAKSILDLSALNDVILSKAQQQVDSIVSEAKTKVRKPTANWYSTRSTLNMQTTDSIKSKLSYDRGFKNFTKNLNVGTGFGVTVFGNNISPNVEISLGYVLNKKANTAKFIGLNWSTFANWKKDINQNYTNYIPLFFEFGRFRNKTGYMQGKTSAGYGVVFKNIGNKTYYLPGILLNFAISNTISTNLIVASEWKKNAEHHIWAVALKYNL